MAVSDFLLDQPCFMHVIWCNLSQILFRENLMANKQHSQTYIPCHRTLYFPSALPASLRLRFSGLQGTLNCQLRSVWSHGYYSSVSEIGHSACLDTSWCKLVAKEGVSSWFLFVFFPKTSLCHWVWDNLSMSLLFPSSGSSRWQSNLIGHHFQIICQRLLDYWRLPREAEPIIKSALWVEN